MTRENLRTILAVILTVAATVSPIVGSVSYTVFDMLDKQGFIPAELDMWSAIAIITSIVSIGWAVYWARRKLGEAGPVTPGTPPDAPKKSDDGF